MAGSHAKARRLPAKPWHDFVLQPGKELKNYYKGSLGAGLLEAFIKNLLVFLINLEVYFHDWYM